MIKTVNATKTTIAEDVVVLDINLNEVNRKINIKKKMLNEIPNYKDHIPNDPYTNT